MRELKANKADKAAVTEGVEKLKSLKAEFKTKFGKEYAPAAGEHRLSSVPLCS